MNRAIDSTLLAFIINLHQSRPDTLQPIERNVWWHLNGLFIRRTYTSHHLATLRCRDLDHHKCSWLQGNAVLLRTSTKLALRRSARPSSSWSRALLPILNVKFAFIINYSIASGVPRGADRDKSLSSIAGQVSPKSPPHGGTNTVGSLPATGLKSTGNQSISVGGGP
jgi:hypothetical protein